jgi:hypothetical protein
MKAEELHRAAMELADRALVAKLENRRADARRLLREAFDKERQAAVEVQVGLEPTRSILYRSAASLAMECGDIEGASRLVFVALAGDPPEDLKEDLLDLFEQITLERHLKLRGITLSDDEFQLSIAGNAVGYGMAQTDEFVNRIVNTEKLLFRVAERTSGRPYREHGQAQAALRGSLQLYISVPRAASFAVTFKVGRNEQMKFPEMDLSKDVVNEFLEDIEIFSSGDEKELKRKIPNPAYYRNFTGLARSLAPDGDAVKTVGFSALRNGRRRDVLLVERQPAAIEPGITQRRKPEVVEIEGELKLADALRKGKNQIKVSPSKGAPCTVVVPEGMMDDIVRPMWGRVVTVKARRKGQKLELLDIAKKSR